MNREQAKALLPIIKAFSEGKTIQWRYIKGNTSLWWDDNNPTFEVDTFDYRIKPEFKDGGILYATDWISGTAQNIQRRAERNSFLWK